MKYRLGLVLAVLVLAVAACDNTYIPAKPSGPLPTGSEPPAPRPVFVPDGTLVGAGDIGMCTPEVKETARLLDNTAGTVFTTGDNAYSEGSLADFARCYDPSWGRHKERTRPTPGNHDYETAGASGYFAYFGENAGPAGRGYYSYKEGTWLVLALNSTIDAGSNSAQATWLRQELAQNPARCTLAYWHHPVFSSGQNGNAKAMRDIWQILYDAGADVVLAGHDHLYERFALQDTSGRPDPKKGIRQFTIGTGGAHLYEFKNIQPNSEVRSATHGVLALTLKSGSYDWRFTPINGKTFQDAGRNDCH